MNILIYKKEYEFHTTPMENIVLNPYSIEIDIDNIEEERYRILIKPYIAFKVVTIDCASSRDYFHEYCYRDGRFHRHILEIENSPWIEQLGKNIAYHNSHILRDVKHFVLPLQDIVIEVIAKELVITKL